MTMSNSPGYVVFSSESYKGMCIVRKRQFVYFVTFGRKVGVVNSSIASGWMSKFSWMYRISSAPGSSQSIHVIPLCLIERIISDFYFLYLYYCTTQFC